LEIGLWVPPPLGEINAFRYQEIQEAGFTFVIGLLEFDKGGEQAVRTALDAAELAGLKYIVHDPRLKLLSPAEMSQIPSLIAPFIQHPALKGHLLKDEPSALEISGLAEVKESYVRAAPGKLAYVNLFPGHAASELLRAEYSEYVEQFMQIYKPQVLSYDHYPFLTEQSVFAGDELTEDYYANLALIREASLRHEVSFWLFIQTLAFNGTHRDPTEAEIRWQVYTSLAFGAVGIQYFTYWTPDDSNETFGDALIDRSGNRTRHYEEVKTINREISAFGSAIASLRSEKVMSWPEQLPQTESAFSPFGPIMEVNGSPVIIGCFKDESEQSSLMIVNRSYDAPAEIQLILNTDVFRTFDIWSGGRRRTVDALSCESGFSLKLMAGEGQLLCFCD
jgi:hypothetical protein